MHHVVLKHGVYRGRSSFLANAAPFQSKRRSRKSWIPQLLRLFGQLEVEALPPLSHPSPSLNMAAQLSTFRISPPSHLNGQPDLAVSTATSRCLNNLLTPPFLLSFPSLDKADHRHRIHYFHRNQPLDSCCEKYQPSLLPSSSLRSLCDLKSNMGPPSPPPLSLETGSPQPKAGVSSSSIPSTPMCTIPSP
jgi:hypothetical protein